MSDFVSQSLWAVALAAVLLLGGQAQAQTPLQQAADDAALAAVQVLAAGGGMADAVAVAQQTAAAFPGMAAQVNASPADLVVTVKLSDAKTAASSTARYLPPEQPATWAWASRQRFAVKSSPVMLGSTCLRDCERNPLR
jgi:hypothetical protein